MWACLVWFYYYVLYSIISSAYNITASINSIHMLNDTNFKSRQENVMIVLRVMDLDLVLMVARLSDLTDKKFLCWKVVYRKVGSFKSLKSDDHEMCYFINI